MAYPSPGGPTQTNSLRRPTSLIGVRRVRRRPRIGWIAACLACVACGGAVHRAASSSSSPRASTPIQLPAQASGDGQAVFAHDCASCHTLIGNESAHKQGGDLIGYQMTRSQLTRQTEVMPTRPLTSAQLRAVVDYVLRAQRAGHG